MIVFVLLFMVVIGQVLSYIIRKRSLKTFVNL